jgi:nitrogen fixation protein NifQ
MTGYTKTILRYATDNRFSGDLVDADGIGEVGLGAEEAGRRIGVRFALRVRDDRVADVRFQVFGCGFSVAACAAAAELVGGLSLDEALAIDADRVNAALDGLPEERRYCADLAVKALHAAVTGVRSDARTVQTTFQPSEEDHGPRVDAADPLYRFLMDAPPPAGAREEDRHLFACLVAVAAREPYATAEALGLTFTDLAELLQSWFPACGPDLIRRHETPAAGPPPEANPDVLRIVLDHVPRDDSGALETSALWLAHILTARAAHPGHLWVSMGLFERPQLSAAIRRHLPSLAEANNRNMRWKRFLFKQVCDLNGGSMCKTPNCGECSDYALCFSEEE